MRRSRSVQCILGRGEFLLLVGGPASGPSMKVLAIGPAMQQHAGQGWASPGQLADCNSVSVVCSIAQLYLDATVVSWEPVVPHWDRSGINLSTVSTVSTIANCKSI